GVDEGNILGPESLPLGAQRHQLGFHLRLLLRLIQIVLPALPQGRVGVALQPQPPQGVLHHVAHDPVGCKELGGGGDALLGDLHILFQQVEGLGFQLGIVILIHPPDDLHLVGPVLLGDVGHHTAKDAVRAEHVVGKEQFSIAAHVLKHLGQTFTQGIALGEQQVPV
ncbi:CotJB protein, partial [Dysosmobacter welbionis]